MPPRTPHQHSFFFLRYKKKECWTRKKNYALLHFSAEKCQYFFLPSKPSQNRGGRSLYLRACGKAAIVSLIDCAKHNPYDARRALKTLRVSLSLCVFLSLFIAKKRKKYTRLKIYLYTILCKFLHKKALDLIQRL